MSPAEVEAQLRADTSWQRPTWPIGRGGYTAWDDDMLRDPLHILDAGRANGTQARRTRSSRRRSCGNRWRPWAWPGL